MSVGDHLVGVAEVGALLGVSRQRVAQIAASYADFPAPEAELASGRIWTREAVEAWLATHPDRKPGRQEGGMIMFERLTEKARAAFTFAQEEARAFGHGYVGCEHMVLAMLRVPDGIAAHALVACGLTLEAGRSALSKILRRGPASAANELLPFTPRVRRALTEAQDAALEFAHNFVGTEHILLGIIREGDNVGCRLLQEAGLDLQAVRLNVLQQMGFPQPRSAPGQDRQLARVLDKLADRLADINARLERLEEQLT